VRCAVHNDREAVGVCIGCGAGVCTACRVAIAGITYCNACLEAGRYRPPSAPSPIVEAAPAIAAGLMGPQIRQQLALGVMGFLMFGIALHLAWIGGLVWPYVWTIAPLGGPSDLVNPVSVVSVVLVGISMTLVGIAFMAYARVFGSQLCQGTAIVSLLSAWWLPIASFLGLTGWVWGPGYYPWYDLVWQHGPLYYPYTVILLTGLALQGVTLLLWPSALIATRHLTRQRAFSVACGVLFLIAAHMIILPLPFNAVAMLSPSGYYYLQYFASYYGIISVACVVEPACILGAILMYRSRPPK